MIGTIFYLLGSINFFLDSDFSKKLSIKLIILIGVTLSMITYQDLFKAGGRITKRMIKRFFYFLGMFIILALNVLGYTYIMNLFKMNVKYW